MPPAVLFLLVTAETRVDTTATPSASPSSSPTPAASPSASPSPIPTPVHAFLSLDISAGGPNTVITITGGQFNPNEQMAIYWDSPNKVIGNATSDGNGNVSNVKVKPFAGDTPGLHQICASVLPNPCAQFELQGSPTPTPTPPPSPSPSPEASPSPTESPTPSPSIVPIPAGSNTNNLDVLFQPPLVFLPFIAALGMIGAIAYWVLGVAAARRRMRPLPSASVVHHSVRPQGLAGFQYMQPDEPAAPPQAQAAAENLPFTPEELSPPWPSVDRPPTFEPEPGGDPPHEGGDPPRD